MSATLPLDQYEISQQTLVENGLLNYLCKGLRDALAWEVFGDDFSRKLSTIQFIMKSLQRHLERLLNLEEIDGYMEMVLSQKPRLEKAVVSLKEDHESFRKRAGGIVQKLEWVSPTDRPAFDAIGEELTTLLDQIDDHNRKEAKLFQEAFGQEEGGEG